MTARAPYKYVSEIDYVADMVGARVSMDALAVQILSQDGPLDVSAATVPVDVIEGVTVEVDEDNPLDVSAATVSVQEDGPLDVSGAPVTTEASNFGSGLDGDTTDDTTGSSLPSNPIPNGATLTIQAKYGNSSRIAVGLTATPTVEMEAGQSIDYKINNTDQVTIVAGTTGDGVNWTVEQEV